MLKKSSLQTKAGVIITVGMLLATFSYYGYQLLFTANFQVDKKDTDLYIPQGATFQTVVDSLEANKILNEKLSFYFISRLLNYKEAVKPGKYHIKANMNNLAVIRMLKNGRQTPVRVTFNNIRLKEDLAERLSQKLGFTATDFMNLINQDAFVQKHGFTKETIMTMFIPNTYEVYWTITPEDFSEKMFQEYKKFWTTQRLQLAKEIGLTPIQVSILASIVEAETNQSKERARIAGVYMNRLKTNMPLQADPTVKFAVGDFTIKRIYSGHIAVDSPYNTYRNIGLPPGPINLPSISSIDAVLNYEKHDYIFFCAHHDLSGCHDFAATFEQHKVLAEKYRKALDKLQIK